MTELPTEAHLVDTTQTSTARQMLTGSSDQQDLTAAIAAYNERIEREGLFGEELRRF
jgi:hypothetical protein